MPATASPDSLPTVGQIAGGRTVSIPRDTRLVNIGFQSTDPALSARVANALARAYLQQSITFRSKMTDDASGWLTKQVSEQRSLVDASEGALQQYRREHGADALIRDELGGQQQNVVVQKLGELQERKPRHATVPVEKQSEYKQLQAAQASRTPLDTIPAIATNLYIQGLKGELTVLQRQMLQASQELGEAHPEMIKLSAAVQNSERKLQTEINLAAAAIRNEFEAAQERERAVSAALARQKVAVRELNGKAVKYTALEREAHSNREVLDQLLQRSREAVLAKQLQSTSVRIVDWAEVPREPDLPAQGAHDDDRLYRQQHVRVGAGFRARALQYPYQVASRRQAAPADTPHRRGAKGRGEGRGRVASARIRRPCTVRGAVPGPATRLMSTPALAERRTLLVTSSEPFEGKTMSAANVAVSLARLRQRVVLIDADLRHPRLHEVFGMDRGRGLANVLTSGQMTGADFGRTKVPGLWLMPAGSSPQSPADSALARRASAGWSTTCGSSSTGWSSSRRPSSSSPTRVSSPEPSPRCSWWWTPAGCHAKR